MTHLARTKNRLNLMYLPIQPAALKKYPSGHLHLQEPLTLMHASLSLQPQYGSESHSSISKEKV